MTQVEIDQLFRSLHLETEEQRAKLRFQPIMIDNPSPVQVFTTDTTLCQAKLPESNPVA